MNKIKNVIELKGKYNNCIVYANEIEEEALKQLNNFINCIVSKDTDIRIMSDVHSGKGCVIGFTMKINEYFIPYLIGVDIGCGVIVYNLGKSFRDEDFKNKEFYEYIKSRIPMGQDVNKENEIEVSKELEKKIKDICIDIEEMGNYDYFLQSVGSLGGGNHFIEINKSENENYYLTVHTGSRNFGFRIANYFQKRAEKYTKKKLKKDLKDRIEGLKKIYRGKKLGEKIQKIKRDNLIFKGLEYLNNEDKERYCEAMKVAQVFANENRRVIIKRILKYFDIKFDNNMNIIESIHNYIDFDDGVIRKGAIRARKGEKVVIPMNMKFGIVIGEGKGNEDWNNSAPHGAGRKFSRNKAKRKIDLKKFEEDMTGIYCEVRESILDEAPDAYKDPDEIIDYVKETIEVKEICKSILNIKA